MIAFVRLSALVRRSFHPITIAYKIGMIEDMISKFMTEATEAANAKAFCDEENAKAQKSQVEKTSFFDEFIARVEEAASKSGILTDAVAEFQKELAEMDKAQAEASEAANAKAFCDEENAKTRKSKRRRSPSSTSSPRASMTVLNPFHPSLVHYVATHARCEG